MIEVTKLDDILMHYGVYGQKWGVRRYQTVSGKLTPEGRRRYSRSNENLSKQQKADEKRLLKTYASKDNAKAARDYYKKKYDNLSTRHKKASDKFEEADKIAKQARQEYKDYKATKKSDPNYSKRKAFSLWDEAGGREADADDLWYKAAELAEDKDFTKADWKHFQQEYNTASKDIGLQAKEYAKKYGQVAYNDFERVRETLYE